MSDSKFHRFYRQFGICLGISIICVPLFLYLLPDIEQGRTEARFLHTEVTIRVLRKQHRAHPPANTIDLEETDIWGTPYRIVPLADGDVRVVSAGPNGTFDGTDPASDDIYSDMPVSPREPIHRQRRREWYIAFGATAALWVTLYFLFGRSEQD